MQSNIERACQDLELAQAEESRLWAEYRALTETLDPARGVADPEELRGLQQASESTWQLYAAEQALFMAEHATPGIVGKHDTYQWINMLDCDISKLLRLCPDVVLGKYLAVTSIDSGTLYLSEQEWSEGWSTSEIAKVYRHNFDGSPEYRDDWQFAYSPRLTSIHGLPNETHDECCAGYDEWYVSEQPFPPGEMEAFVNWGGFRLYAPEFDWCADRLWAQMERLGPESYIAHGSFFTFATRNPALFSNVLAALSKNSE